MKSIRWLVALAGKNPLIFSLALLMIAVSALSIVVTNRDTKIDDCNKERQELYNYYLTKLNFIDSNYKVREAQLNGEVKILLGAVIDDYKQQLLEQKKLNLEMQKEITKNENLIKKATSKIKTL